MNNTQNSTNDLLKFKKINDYLTEIENIITSRKDPELEKGLNLVLIMLERLCEGVAKNHEPMKNIRPFLWYFLNSSVKQENEKGEEFLVITPSISNLISRSSEHFWYSLNKNRDVIDKTKDLKIHSVELKDVLIKIATIHFPDFFEEKVVAV